MASLPGIEAGLCPFVPGPPSAASTSPSLSLPQANLPLLQRELLHCARLAKQTPAQYLAQHEQLLLDANASSPIDSAELLLEVNENGKRRTPDRYLGGFLWLGRETVEGLSPGLPLVPQLSWSPSSRTERMRVNTTARS